VSVVFASGVTEVELQNPDLNNVLRDAHRQTFGRMSSGQLYVYKKGSKISFIEVAWSELRDDEKAAIRDFINTTVDASMNTFTYTDHRGDAWTARIVDNEHNFTEIADQRESSSSFTIDSATYPTTVREKGIWALRLVMEVEPAGD